MKPKAKPTGDPKLTQNVGVRFTEAEYRILARQARADDRKLSDYLRRAIRQLLQEVG